MQACIIDDPKLTLQQKDNSHIPQRKTKDGKVDSELPFNASFA